MSRFQIQDLVAQDATRVIFLAEDESTGERVALRRFFSAGDGEQGVARDDQEGFLEAVEALSRVRHPSLRGVIEGGIDPVDGVPFIATQWVDGDILGDLLEDAVLSEEDGLMMVGQALDVLEMVQAESGTDANWLDLRPEDIVIRQTADGPRFTFWLSLARWLRDQSGGEAVAELADLVERCCGLSEGRLSRSGRLREWLTHVRENHPTVAESRGALDYIKKQKGMPVANSLLVTGAQPEAASQPHPVVAPLPSSSGMSRATGVVVGVAVAVFLGVVGLIAYLVVKNRPEAPVAHAVEESAKVAGEAGEVAGDGAPAAPPAEPPPDPTPAPAEARVESPRKVSSAQDEIAAKVKAMQEANRKLRSRTEFSAEEGDELRLLPNKLVKVTGVVTEVRETGSYFYWEFGDRRSRDDVVIRMQKPKRSKLKLQNLKNHQGKNLVFHGRVQFYGPNRRVSIAISTPKAIGKAPKR